MAVPPGDFAKWLSAHPHTLVSGAIGLVLGVVLTMPFGLELPDPAAAMVGALVGAGAVVGGSLWAANVKQFGEEEAAAEARRSSEHRIAVLLAIEATQHIVPLMNSINEARNTYTQAETYFLAGNHQYMLERLKLGYAGKFPTGIVLGQLPIDLGRSIAELNFFLASYEHIIASIKFTENPDKETIKSFIDLTLGETLDLVQKSLSRVAEQLVQYIPAIRSIDFTHRPDGSHI